MSYCRFGPESDVYVYMSSTGLECCGCSLDADGFPQFGTNEGMIAHLNKHVAAGDQVPERAFERLRDPEDAAENQAILARGPR